MMIMILRLPTGGMKKIPHSSCSKMINTFSMFCHDYNLSSRFHSYSQINSEFYPHSTNLVVGREKSKLPISQFGTTGLQNICRATAIYVLEIIILLH